VGVGWEEVSRFMGSMFYDRRVVSSIWGVRDISSLKEKDVDDHSKGGNR